MELEKELNRSQYDAVTTTEGPVMVIAGAGSGKTRVIEYRVAHLVQKNVDPKAILLLTFTRNASREMLSRAVLRDERCAGIDGGTFHSFAYKMIRKYSKRLGFPERFTILDEGDAGDVVHKCCLLLGLREKDKKFPKRGTLRSIMSMMVNKHQSVT
jgi:DNA helicase-2/ATP-dependent DNA helicase PcrA